MLQMGVQVTFAWLGPLRVLSGVLITGVVRHNRCSIAIAKKKNFVGWAAPLLDRGWSGGWSGHLALAARRRGEARCVHSWHVGGGAHARLQGEMEGFLDLGVPFDREP